ncbi:Ig-like domain-containing protein [Archangium sp.]|jgi:hypothetical protein|uniref:Ig-like domain-containing protein n=1 Tax=Archangium sp. TaxID=1872627 RepID=UPI002ED90B56
MNWRSLSLVASLVVMGCNPQLEDPASSELAELHDALTSSVTQTVTPGVCTTNVVFETISAPAPGFRATCSSKCLNESTVTLRLQIEEYTGSIWPWVSFNYTGFAAKVGGSASTQYSNASPGLYRARCNVDYSDSNRNHFSADVISAELEQARTDDVTPPTVVLTAPVSGTESSGTVTITADATDNVGVKKVEFYRNGALMVTDTTPPFATGLNFADSYYPAGPHTFHAKAYDAMGNASTSQSATVTKVVVVCNPTTCEQQGKNCDFVDDGCGGWLDCGYCAGSEICGGTGVDNVCGTPPPPPTAQVSLSVSGRSGERVTSNPTGLSVSVGQTGTASFVVGTSVTLTTSNSREAIWSGACSSGGAKARRCTFTVQGNASVSANIQ